MENLKKLSEITTRYGNRNINELEFKTPEDFAAYKKKHKMRPGTVVKVAGKDKVVGDDKPKGKKAKVDSIEFSSFGEKDIKRFADRYGVEVSNIRDGQQGVEADFEGDPEKIKKILTSDDYGMEPEDADDLIGTTPEVDPKIDKDMASAANKANMKMDRDEIMGLLNAKNEPFAEEVYDILDDNFDKMGSVGKELKQKVDTLAAYEMGIYDMSEKEYEQGREELKKKLDDYYKEQGLDEGIKDYFKEGNISNKGNKKMIAKTFGMLALYFIPYILMLSLQMNAGGVLLMYLLMGIGMAGIGMGVMHDAIHGAYHNNPIINKIAIKIAINLKLI